MVMVRQHGWLNVESLARYLLEDNLVLQRQFSGGCDETILGQLRAREREGKSHSRDLEQEQRVSRRMTEMVSCYERATRDAVCMYQQQLGRWQGRNARGSLEEQQGMKQH